MIAFVPRLPVPPVSVHPAELRLRLAVLEDAVRIIHGGVRSREHRRRAAFIEAMEWIFSDNLGWPFSFRNVCVAVDVDAQRLRARITGALAAASFPLERRAAQHKPNAHGVRPGT